MKFLYEEDFRDEIYKKMKKSHYIVPVHHDFVVKLNLAQKTSWIFCFLSIQLYQGTGFCAFLIAYIIEFSRYNTPLGCGKF